MAELEVGVGVDSVYEGRYLDAEAMGYEVVEAANISALPEVEANFLMRFALGGSLEIIVLRLDPTTGKGDIAGPGIALDAGALDKKQLQSLSVT